jgi:hypothetical protein
MVIDKNAELIRALVNNEESLAALYKSYSATFPGYKDFWLNIYSDELEHANKLRTLLGINTANADLHTKGRFNIIAVQNFTKHVLAEANPATIRGLSLINALSVALSLEQGLIEQKYFEVFETDSTEIKNVFSLLADETRKHLEKVRKLWTEEGRKNRP